MAGSGVGIPSVMMAGGSCPEATVSCRSLWILFTAILSPVRNAFYFAFLSGRLPARRPRSERTRLVPATRIPDTSRNPGAYLRDAVGHDGLPLLKPTPGQAGTTEEDT